ncbi:TRAP transporter small permease [Hoeflea sp. CAU 1731]
MLSSTVATGLIALWLILGRLFFGTGIGLKEFLSPADTPSVLLAMIVGAIALLSASIYLSDTCGVVESKSDGFFDVVSLVCSRLAMIATVTVVLVMFYEVVSRYLFGKPTLWANELSLWIAGFVFLLAGLYAMQQRSHIRIYIIYDMMPRWLRKLSDVLSLLLIGSFAFLTVWGGFNESRDKFFRWETFGTAWDPPIPATIKPAILIIVVLVALQALSNLIADWNKEPEHHSAANDIDASEIEAIRKIVKD